MNKELNKELLMLLSGIAAFVIVAATPFVVIDINTSIRIENAIQRGVPAIEAKCAYSSLSAAGTQAICTTYILKKSQ